MGGSRDLGHDREHRQGEINSPLSTVIIVVAAMMPKEKVVRLLVNNAMHVKNGTTTRNAAG